MARLIFICPYISGNGIRRSNHVNYIATREGVEILAAKELNYTNVGDEGGFVEELQSEYLSFENDANSDNPEKRSILVNYIAERPGVQKIGTNGLFSMTDEKIVLSNVRKEIAEHEGNVWIPIISLTREDSEQFGYNNAETWKNLLRAHSADIAESMKIHPDNLRWYAAYHNKDTHPHVHMVIYSTDPKDGYLTKTGIRQLKSALANDIFRPEMLEYYSQKTEQRDELNLRAQDVMKELIEQMETGTMENEKIELLVRELSEALKTVSGKKQYGYLSPRLKSVVDEITNELAKDTRVAEAYTLWNEMQNAVINIYTDNLPEPLPLSQQKEFKTVRNMIIREALALSDSQVHVDLASKEELESYNRASQPETAVMVNTHQPRKISYTPQANAALSISAATRLLYNMGNIFRSTVPMNYYKAQHIDHKRRAELMRLRRTHGVKGNDYEQNM
ncbi:MAG: MobP3 family relaxase [Oscillospiraceae bacterium]|nr:MobP3 family relaxase [Oscillospiraceae bacterium]